MKIILQLRKKLFLWCLIGFWVVYSVQADSIDLSVSSAEQTKMPLIVGIIGDTNKKLTEVGNILKTDLSFSGQFQVQVQYVTQRPSKKTIKELFKQGYVLAVFINDADKGKAIEWRIYDTMQASMVCGKKYKKQGMQLRGWAHNCADAMWPLLTGQEGFFSSKIAYCKELTLATGARVRYIYVADYDGSDPQVLVDMPTITVAPRWNGDIRNPLLFYSEYTNTNVRLMVVDMHKKRKIASNFDGINMLPAFSQDGKSVVYCASRGDGCCQLYRYQKGELQRLTHNYGNNISPVLADNGQRVYFCSDFQTGNPQIFVSDLQTGLTKRITKGGYCTSPAYCPKREQLAYTKMVNRTMQIYVYDCQKKTHRQLTQDAGNKHECTWSPCGNYILFSLEQGGNGRIAILNLLTNERRYLTTAQSHCCYPAWSPIYRQFPVVS